MKNKPIRKALSLLFALVMVVSCFASTASAAESTSLLGALSDSFSKALVSATANPTPDTPLTYSYTTPTIYCRDMYGRPSSRQTYVNFYISKEAYEKGAEPIYTKSVGGYYADGTFVDGKTTVTIEDLFSQKPPATLYFVVDPQPDTVYTPMNGTVYAQYAG